jgi:hypothetical protein
VVNYSNQNSLKFLERYFALLDALHTFSRDGEFSTYACTLINNRLHNYVLAELNCFYKIFGVGVKDFNSFAARDLTESDREDFSEVNSLFDKYHLTDNERVVVTAYLIGPEFNWMGEISLINCKTGRRYTRPGLVCIFESALTKLRQSPYGHRLAA